ncbi:MAG: hypothetical protein WC678_05275 [Parcubacteria group bacterium]|jgi:hypothetical protein
MNKYRLQRKKRWYDPTTRSVVVLFLIMLLVNWILNFDIDGSSSGIDKKENKLAVDKNKVLIKEKIFLSYSPKGEAQKVFGKIEEKKLPDPLPEIIIEEPPLEVKAPIPKAPLPHPIPVKISCKHPSDNPSKSKTKKHSHVDEDCCPDPDEYPKPGCVYSAKGLSILKKPKK